MRNKWIKKALSLCVMLVVTTVFSVPIPALAAPVSTISLTGTSGTNGWYISNVTVTLTATDNISGVERIEYSLDNGGNWLTYSSPFIMSNEGVNQVLARGWDNQGYVESPPASREVKIDKTAPVITLVTAPTQITRERKNFMVDVSYNGTATDLISGLYEAHVVLIDEYSVYNGNLGPNLSGVFAVEAWSNGYDPDGRIYWFRVWATDLAGNQTHFDAETTIIRN